MDDNFPEEHEHLLVEEEMSKVDWYYHRSSWNTCAKTQEFLAKHNIDTEVRQSASKKLQAPEALALVEDVDEIYSMKGKKVNYLNLKTDKPDEDAILALLLGPTGNLRAPTLRKGKTLVVGFNQEAYDKVFS